MQATGDGVDDRESITRGCGGVTGYSKQSIEEGDRVEDLKFGHGGDEVTA